MAGRFRVQECFAGGLTVRGRGVRSRRYGGVVAGGLQQDVFEGRSERACGRADRRARSRLSRDSARSTWLSRSARVCRTRRTRRSVRVEAGRRARLVKGERIGVDARRWRPTPRCARSAARQRESYREMLTRMAKRAGSTRRAPRTWRATTQRRARRCRTRRKSPTDPERDRQERTGRRICLQTARGDLDTASGASPTTADGDTHASPTPARRTPDPPPPPPPRTGLPIGEADVREPLWASEATASTACAASAGAHWHRDAMPCAAPESTDPNAATGYRRASGMRGASGIGFGSGDWGVTSEGEAAWGRVNGLFSLSAAWRSARHSAAVLAVRGSLVIGRSFPRAAQSLALR